ncbi:probable G-protein coupled receptor Mth-like 11 [Drosophila sulfurigaster albostrigata]|uniref:probable G-protein coupled receptor Mth-like 11 n=1 Tax=Drosophila sulfurigaster albostrigata TaxID=89887 RepID=UPI002D21CF3C|nr:probable G-protein coupled receptor Mth-like 11 [Drosophila sulfurigaster albostrigata]
MIIYITLYTTLYIVTASKIFFQNRINRRQLTQSERQRNLRTLTNFGTFFWLFVIMGVFWIFEIISYFGYIFDISIKCFDVITCCQGITLFVATILKRDVLNALANRLRIGNTVDASAL